MKMKQKPFKDALPPPSPDTNYDQNRFDFSSANAIPPAPLNLFEKKKKETFSSGFGFFLHRAMEREFPKRKKKKNGSRDSPNLGVLPPTARQRHGR
jgi:hypothetical protein